MTKAVINLPIFPLSVYLLPEGITRLRIFEQRYLKMVKIATKGQGFVILSAIDKSASVSTTKSANLVWGSWVEIINFDQSKEGVLEIDVKCKSLVEVISTKNDADNLMFGEVVKLAHWSQGKNGFLSGELSTSLVSLFNNTPLLNELYSDRTIDNPQWVIARWLELLPVSTDIKNTFILSNSFEAAKGFVESILFSK